MLNMWLFSVLTQKLHLTFLSSFFFFPLLFLISLAALLTKCWWGFVSIGKCWHGFYFWRVPRNDELPKWFEAELISCLFFTFLIAVHWFNCLQVLMCPEHEMEKVNMYCEVCRRPVCHLCKLGGSHANHKVTSMSNAYKILKVTLTLKSLPVYSEISLILVLHQLISVLFISFNQSSFQMQT